MSQVQPYAPSASEVPQRGVLIANTDNEVLRVKESVLTKDGVAFTGYAEYAPMPGDAKRFYYTVTYVQFPYSADGDTTLDVSVSGDGGESWTTKEVTISETSGGIVWGVAGFFNVTGPDIRIRFQFDTAVAVKVFGMYPRIIRRGAADVAAP